MPSMPMFTMPERSFMTPHSAPSAIGVGEAEHDRRDAGRDLDHVADELEEHPDDRDAVQDVHQVGSRCRRSCVTVCSSVGSALGSPDAQRAPDDDVGGEEEEDRGLDDVDDLDRDAGLDLHQPGAGAHRPEEERRQHDAHRVRATEERDRDRVEADRGPVRGGHEVADAQDLPGPGQARPAARTATSSGS